MTYLHLALKAEALPLISHFKLTLSSEIPYRVYSNNEYYLTISLLGYDNALMATTALLTRYPPKQNDIFLNIGLCGAPDVLPIGTLIGVSTLYFENEYEQTLKPLAALQNFTLRTQKRPQEEAIDSLADMEAYATIKAASRFMEKEQLGVLKVVSDHFEPHTLTKNSAQTLMHQNLAKIENYLQTFKEQRCQQQL